VYVVVVPSTTPSPNVINSLFNLISKSLITAVPLLSLTTFLMTVNVGATSLFVILHTT